MSPALDQQLDQRFASLPIARIGAARSASVSPRSTNSLTDSSFSRRWLAAATPRESR